MYGDKDSKYPTNQTKVMREEVKMKKTAKGINDEDTKSSIWKNGRRNGRIGKGGNEVEESAEANWMKHTMSSKG